MSRTFTSGPLRSQAYGGESPAGFSELGLCIGAGVNGAGAGMVEVLVIKTL